MVQNAHIARFYRKPLLSTLHIVKDYSADRNCTCEFYNHVYVHARMGHTSNLLEVVVERPGNDRFMASHGESGSLVGGLCLELNVFILL